MKVSIVGASFQANRAWFGGVGYFARGSVLHEISTGVITQNEAIYRLSGSVLGGAGAIFFFEDNYNLDVDKLPVIQIWEKSNFAGDNKMVSRNVAQVKLYGGRHDGGLCDST